MESSIEHFRKHTGPLAIQCDKITFAYKKGKPILEGLTMSVPRASTYSVLGASSAGKTTLLKLISGFMKPQKGSIKIFGQKPGSRKCSVPGPGVGFVSQDLCVYPNFSIKATLTYFAQINNVPYAEINKRIMYIRHYLELPEENRLVANLSGGQKRRVSLAIAMIHSPPLLILDEPTVGIDPYLRYKVWNYFDELRNKGHTVVITTHYIEETTNSDLIGYIRNGKLICEQNPQLLLKAYNTINLEDILFLLCREQTNQIRRQKSLTEVLAEDQPEAQIKDDGGCFDFEPRSLVSAVKTDTKNFMIVTKRTWELVMSKLFNVFLILFYTSLMMVMFYGMIYKLPDQTRVGIINPDQGVENHSLAQELLAPLVNKSEMIYFNNREEMVTSIEHGRTLFGIEFQSNFTECMRERIEEGLRVDDDVLECTQIHTFGDTTLPVQFWSYSYWFLDSFRQMLRRYMGSLSLTAEAYLPALTAYDHEGQLIPMDFSVGSYILLGVVSGLNFFIPLSYSGLLWHQEMEHGIFLRSYVHNVSKLQFMLSHFLVQSFLTAISNFLFLMVVVYIFNFPWTFNLITAYLLLFIQANHSILLGQVIGLITNNQLASLVAIFSIALPNFFTCGLFWPIDEHSTLQWLFVKFFPLALPTQAYRKIFIKNYFITHPDVYSAFLILFLFIAILIVVAMFAIRKSKLHYEK